MSDTPRETKDDGFKTVLGNHELFVQFLSDFIEIDILKDVTPDDIEDMTERFIMMGIDGKDGYTVKKINLKGKEPLFVVGLVEHQQKVNHRMSFRFLQYSVFIWHDYEKEQNALRKGASELKDFKYPPILPIVYYTGENKWTSPLNFYDKVHLNTVFERFIPKFEYLLIDSNNYTQEDLMKNKDILSLFLIIDKIKRSEQIPELRDIPKEFYDELDENTPEHLKELVCNVIVMFLTKLDITEDERDEITNNIKTRRFSEMFALIDGYSVTKTREEASKRAKEEERIEIATNLLLEGDNIEKIARVSKLTQEKVIELKELLRQEGKLLELI